MTTSKSFASACALAAVTLLLLALPVQATGLDFEDIAVPVGGNTVGNDFVTGGYLIHGTEHLHLIHDLFPAVSWNGSTWLGIHEPDNEVSITRQNGGAFSLASLQASEFFGSPNGTQVLVTGTTTSGSALTQSFSLDDIADGSGPLDDFQTVAFSTDWNNLTSVTFQATAGGGERWYALDNIAVTVAAVPEPETWLMLAGGLVILGAARHRRCAPSRSRPVLPCNRGKGRG